jgi:hypothetical protein
MSLHNYFWQLKPGGKLFGPTFRSRATTEEHILDIQKIMNIDDTTNIILHKETYYDNKPQEDVVTANRKWLHDIVAPHGMEVHSWSDFIKPAVGRDISADIAYHTVHLFHGYSNMGICYHLDDPKQHNQFIKEITKRARDRLARRKKQKQVEGRTTNIGSFEACVKEIIKSATFELYLDADQEIPDADVTVVGEVKFFKRSGRRVMFDIDERKIFALSDNKEITADNIDNVFDALIKCLANNQETTDEFK